jgi:protein-S-isoprenylcysteine O-methyltransferase Ste14
MFAASLAFFLYSYLVRFGRPATDPGVVVPVAIDATLFTLFALHHSLFARPLVKRWLFGVRAGSDRGQTEVEPGSDRGRSGVRPGSDLGLTPLERPTYVWVASVLFIAVCAAWRPVPGELYHVTGVLALAAYAVHAAGIVLTARGSARLDVLDLAGVRAVSPSAATHVPLQTHGVYGFVRHPVYFAWVLMVIGTPHMTMTRLTFAVISTTYLAIAIPFEERGLLDVFGPEYREYQKQVRWRMIPGVY